MIIIGVFYGRVKDWGGRGMLSWLVFYWRVFSEGFDSCFGDGFGRGGKWGCSFDGGWGRFKGRGGEKWSVLWLCIWNLNVVVGL